MRVTRAATGVVYSQADDRFAVPLPSRPGRLAIALGDDVRAELAGELPRNGAHLRDVIISVAIGTRPAR